MHREIHSTHSLIRSDLQKAKWEVCVCVCVQLIEMQTDAAAWQK